MNRRGWILWEMTIVLLIVTALATVSLRLLFSTTKQTSRLLAAERDAELQERVLLQLRADVLTAVSIRVGGEADLRIDSEEGEIEWYFGTDGTIAREVFLLTESRSVFRATERWQVTAVAGGVELRRGDRTTVLPTAVLPSRGEER